MSEKFRLDRNTRFQNTFYAKCINVIIDSFGPSIILRSILPVTKVAKKIHCLFIVVYLGSIEHNMNL